MQEEAAEERSAMDYVAAVLMTVLAAWGVYTTFLIMGALLGSIVEQGQIRFFGSLILALGIPGLTAMGMNSRKEGAQGVDRMSRFSLGTLILSIGCAAVVSVTMADKVIPTLSRDSNWFMSNRDAQTGPPDLNRRYSRILSGLVCSTAHAAGFYYCPSDQRG